MLTLDHLSYSYFKGRPVLTDVNASFGPGVHLLLGPNGAGKTTLLRLMAGLLRPAAGFCDLDGQGAAYHQPHFLKEMFLLTDNAELPLDTIRDMVRIHAPFYPNFSRELLDEGLSLFGMTGDERLQNLSLGDRHKANVAYALALGTRVLLLDEPANGLDITSKKALTRLIADTMARDDERCIIVATHTVQEMRNLFDSVTVLNHGEVVLNVATYIISERLSFIGDSVCRPDAFYFEPSFDGPSQVVPNTDGRETPIDFILLYNAAVGDKASALKSLLRISDH